MPPARWSSCAAPTIRRPAGAIHGAFGLALLNETKHAVGENDERDDDRFYGDARRTLEHPRSERHDDRGEEQVDQWVCELGQEPAPRLDDGAGREFVGTHLVESCGGLDLGQTTFYVSTEDADYFARIEQRRIAGERPFWSRLSHDRRSSHPHDRLPAPKGRWFQKRWRPFCASRVKTEGAAQEREVFTPQRGDARRDSHRVVLGWFRRTRAEPTSRSLVVVRFAGSAPASRRIPPNLPGRIRSGWPSETHVGMSLGYVTARLVECAFIGIGLLSLLTIVTLGHGATAADSGSLLLVNQSLVALHNWTFLLGPGLVDGVGTGMILGYLMFKSGLVSPQIALIGVIGGTMLAASGFAVLLGIIPQGSAVQNILTAPEIIWELFLGPWLTFKGFRALPAISEAVRGETVTSPVVATAG